MASNQDPKIRVSDAEQKHLDRHYKPDDKELAQRAKDADAAAPKKPGSMVSSAAQAGAAAGSKPSPSQRMDKIDEYIGRGANMDKKAVQGHRAQMESFFKLAHVESEVAADLYQLHAENAIKRPSAEQQAKWKEQSITELKKEFGSSYKNRLDEIDSLLKKDPEIRRALNVAGLGNHPKVVMTLAKAAVKMFS